MDESYLNIIQKFQVVAQMRTYIQANTIVNALVNSFVQEIYILKVRRDGADNYICTQ